MSILRAVIIILSGVLILRVSGRKSISQMSISQTVIMISIGSLMVQPLATNNIPNTLLVAVTFVLTLILLEFIQLKSLPFERFINGKALVVIENGKFNIKNLKKTRMTIDKLEMRLRQKGISKISDVKTCTFEINGEIGYELKDEVKPLTLNDLKQVLQELGYQTPSNLNVNSANLFNEVKQADPTI